MKVTNPSVAASPRRAAKRYGSRAEKSDEIRRALFRAAAEVVGEQGYSGASIARITERADVAHGTFYNYFDSRQDILDQLLPVLGDDLIQYIRRRVADCRDPVKREELRIRAFFEFLIDNPGFYRILNEAEMFAPEGFRRHFSNMFDSYRRALARGQKEGGIQDYDERELEVLITILLSARNYLSLCYAYSDGRIQQVPEWVISAYMKLVTGGFLRGPGDAEAKE